ncbi:response regulator [Polaribacter porphyrae]|uniref:DNA-binding response regulator n=1 Tax=Polaribacter porphyrae TaxID=1137780 RepID=A0A2S7WS65_9FLAO|nr:response regulator transcription factor [Polaribacter porphyrae]PQJ80435.1 hypothetical protein BTO18_15200 [Polaribacter porphyrae]
MQKNREFNVWIVEDDVMFKESLEDLMNVYNEFNLVHSVDSVEKAIQVFGVKEKPDIILQDIGLPGLSGIEAISIYKKLYPEVFIIILTIFDDDERVFDAIKAGADGYLLKRTPGTEIVNGMKQVLNGGASISPPIAKKMMRMLVNPSTKKKTESVLTDRELVILKYLVDGLTINAVAEKLIISRHTVDTHTKNIYRKLHVHNRINLVSVALKKGLI